jgi:hypothetical protein
MTHDELALAVMDDDGYGCAITTEVPAQQQVPVCRRCKRVAVGWPLERGDRCSPRSWWRCIRDPEVVMAENAGLS